MKYFKFCVIIMLMACQPKNFDDQSSAQSKDVKQSMATLNIAQNFDYDSQKNVDIEISKSAKSEVNRVRIYSVADQPLLLASMILINDFHKISAVVAKNHQVIKIEWLNTQGVLLGEKDFNLANSSNIKLLI